MNDGDRRSRESRDRSERGGEKKGEKFESKERFLKLWAKRERKGVEAKTLGLHGELVVIIIVVFLMVGWGRCIQSHGM